MQSVANPLLTPTLEIPFDQIRAEHIEPAVGTLLEQAKAALARIERADEPPSYDNTLGALEIATERLEIAMNVVGHLEAVTSTADLRRAYNAVQPEVSAFYASIPLAPALYRRIKDFAQTDEANQLGGPKRRLLTKTLDDFRRHGAELDDAGKRELEQLSRELAELTAKFGQNVVDATARFELVITEEPKLAGLPETARSAARASARQKGVDGWRFTLQAPSVIALLTYLDDATIREAIYRAQNSRAASGQSSNVPLVARILELRKRKAQLLSYQDFADLVLEDRMARDGATAERFVRDLADKARQSFELENEALRRFARTLTSSAEIELKPWDIGYLAEKQRQRLYDFDEEELRPYFSLERALRGLFTTAAQLYGVSVVENRRLSTWHTDVRAYDLLDARGAVLGSFYTDFFPRDEKRGGAWMSTLITAVAGDATRSRHVALICGNVTPPIDDRPALLTHREVETLFHEFGHLLHQLLSQVSVRSLAGTNVAWDFVELPSQIMENWCWEREALDSFALHYETGQRIPQDLFDKMLRARTYRAGNDTLRQLGFAATDLALHREYDPQQSPDLLAFCRERLQGFSAAKLPPDHAMIASFTHLFSSSVGYAAGYYSYKWAEVLDADAFTLFKQAGIFAPEVGRAFRECILAKGDSEEPMHLYKAFAGREPSLEPLLKRAGLLPESSGLSSESSGLLPAGSGLPPASSP